MLDPVARQLTLLLVATALILSGDAIATSRKPQCQVDGQFTDQRVGNAGCLVMRQGRILLVRHGASGKLTFPAGYAERGESAQCTAHRETWEEAGVEVRVGRLVKIFENDFHLYSCELEGFEGPTSGSLEVPVTAAGEIREVLWVDSVTLTEKDWRFPQFFGEVKTILASYAR